LGEPGPGRAIRLALAGLALFDLAFYLFAIGPLGESDRERAQRVSQLQRLAQARTGEVAKLATIVEKVQTARTQGDQLLVEVALPRRTAYSSIVSELDEACKKAGVDLRDRAFNVEPVEGSDTLSIMTVTAGLEGNYENLVRFLNLLDRSSRFLIIESLGASPQQTGTMLNVSLKLDTFVRES
jgi:type IV pilus assembly protein PilO